MTIMAGYIFGDFSNQRWALGGVKWIHTKSPCRISSLQHCFSYFELFLLWWIDLMNIDLFTAWLWCVINWYFLQQKRIQLYRY